MTLDQKFLQTVFCFVDFLKMIWKCAKKNHNNLEIIYHTIISKYTQLKNIFKIFSEEHTPNLQAGQCNQDVLQYLPITLQNYPHV